MVSSNTEVTDDSATISDEEDPTADTDSIGNEDEAVDSPPQSDSCPFQAGEKVFAWHSDRLYEAKVQSVEFWKDAWRYYVHYLGWSKNWDEWVPMDRVLKYSKENERKRQLIEKNKNSNRELPLKLKHSAVPRGKKRKNDDSCKEKETPAVEKLFNIQIPPALKKQLVDDSHFVNHLGKVVKLPRTPTVDDIFKKYAEYRLKKDNKIADSVEEISSGLRCYFDKALPAMLLYKTERRQYQDKIRESITPSSVYGAEHLLRLFVKLPELLCYANIEEETLSILQQRITDFLRFLQKNHSSFFLSSYETAGSFNVEED